jgi:nitrogen fixation NifU-like protein
MAENLPYSEKVIEHFMNPRNMGEIENADGVGTVGNPSCGDVMRLYIKVEDNRITDIKFKTFGCGAAIATSSMTTELVKGKTIDEALEVSNQAVAEALGGLPQVKMHCSVLAEEALRAAIEDYRKKQEGTESPAEGVKSESTVQCCRQCEIPENG